MANVIKRFGSEITRRGVHRALGAYVVLVWLLAQGLVDFFPAMGLPNWVFRAFMAAAVAATPIVALVAWKYDLTTKGFLRDRVDAAAAREDALKRAIGPTKRSDLNKPHPAGMVRVSWRDNTGKVCEQDMPDAFVIGRDFGAEVRIWDDRVSRRHVQVYPAGEAWFVKDLASLNGSYVDGQKIDTQKIEGEVELSLDKDGPKIQLNVTAADETRLTVESV